MTEPDLSDEGLRKLAEAMFDMDMDESAQALLEVRDQARASYDQVKNLLDSRETKLLMRWGELFPNYTWTDGEMAIDYMAAEIIACRKERDQARAAELNKLLQLINTRDPLSTLVYLRKRLDKLQGRAAEEGGKDA